MDECNELIETSRGDARRKAEQFVPELVPIEFVGADVPAKGSGFTRLNSRTQAGVALAKGLFVQDALGRFTDYAQHAPRRPSHPALPSS